MQEQGATKNVLDLDPILPRQVNILRTSVSVSIGLDMSASAIGPLHADTSAISMCGRDEKIPFWGEEKSSFVQL